MSEVKWLNIPAYRDETSAQQYLHVCIHFINSYLFYLFAFIKISTAMFTSHIYFHNNTCNNSHSYAWTHIHVVLPSGQKMWTLVDADISWLGGSVLFVVVYLRIHTGEYVSERVRLMLARKHCRPDISGVTDPTQDSPKLKTLTKHTDAHTRPSPLPYPGSYFIALLGIFQVDAHTSFQPHCTLAFKITYI